jgi:aminopeptidase N
LIKFKPKLTKNTFALKPYFFGDAGVMLYRDIKNVQQLAAPRIDAGTGILLQIKRFWYFEELEPLTIRFDMPVFLNRPPFDEGKFVKMRWLLSVRQSF